MSGALVGSRIRERRIALGQRQSDVARSAGISPSYLNLIEHNRRGIAGKVLIEIASALNLDVASLTEEADSHMIRRLQAAAVSSEQPVEIDAVEDLVSRYPGWARLIAQQQDRAAQLEQIVESLSDRLAHDPFLAESLHEMLSSVTAILATSSILTQAQDMEGLQQRRFQANIHEESGRLSELSQGLVSYFDTLSEAERSLATPLDEVEEFLKTHQFHFAELENGTIEKVDDIISRSGHLVSQSSRQMATKLLNQYVEDTRLMHLDLFMAAALELDYTAPALAHRFGVPLDAVYRRLAFLPPVEGQPEFGLIVCDGTGAAMLRKPHPGFALPRYGSACALWPLYQAISRPYVPISAVLETADEAVFVAQAYCSYQNIPAPGQAPVVRSTMIFHATGKEAEKSAGLPFCKVGQSCRICPRAGCSARREPSIHGGKF